MTGLAAVGVAVFEQPDRVFPRSRWPGARVSVPLRALHSHWFESEETDRVVERVAAQDAVAAADLELPGGRRVGHGGGDAVGVPRAGAGRAPSDEGLLAAGTSASRPVGWAMVPPAADGPMTCTVSRVLPRRWVVQQTLAWITRSAPSGTTSGPPGHHEIHAHWATILIMTRVGSARIFIVGFLGHAER